MKTLKLIIATIAISGIASTASAEIPAHVQERLQEIEHLKRGQGHGKAQKAGSTADKDTSGNVHEDESEDVNGKRAEKGKRAGKGMKADRDKPTKKAQTAGKDEKTRSGKPAKTSAKARAPKAEESDGEDGLEAHEKEERKHLRRLAQFERLEQIAARNGNDRLSEKVSMLREKEARRHERAMARLAARAI